jgi:molybdopterin-containing oxidoreductase family iron-sulfur binding subunit
VIEQLHTLPNVNYLAKVRNTDELQENIESGAEHGFQNNEPGLPSERKEAPAQAEPAPAPSR